MASERLTIDTDPHPVFRVYSNGNFGEVAPERISIMSWSLVGEPMERATRELVDRIWYRSRWHTGSHFVFVAYFACRPYHNLAAYAHLASEVPGVRPGDVAALYFEDTVAPQTHKGMRAGRAGRAKLLGSLPRELLSLRPRMTQLEGEVAELEQDARDALSRGSHVSLGRVMARARQALDTAWDIHIANTVNLVPLSAMQRASGRLVDNWDEVESWLKRPDELVWPRLYDAAASSAALGESDFLSSPFYEVADALAPWSGYVSAHRQARPAPAPAARRDDSLPDLAGALWGMMSRPRRFAPRTVARAISDTLAGREESKSLAMRVLHVFRCILPEVAAAQGIAAADWPFLTVSEVETAPPGHARIAEARRGECEAAVALALPGYLDLESVPGYHALTSAALAAEPRRSRKGRGVSPGTATGIAVTLETIDDADPGSNLILVCESADADIEPVLPRVRGLLSARGSVLSHVSILVREHGLPGVVGHPLALEVGPGDLLTIDGSTGEASVLTDEASV